MICPSKALLCVFFFLGGCFHDVDRFTQDAGDGRIDAGEAFDGGAVDVRDAAPDASPSDASVEGSDTCVGLDWRCLKDGEQLVPFSFEGDCEIAACPADAPYVVGCDVEYTGGIHVCVAHHPDDSRVYIQEGDDCCLGGFAKGNLICSSTPGEPLGAANCVLRKAGESTLAEVKYPEGCGGCADSHCDNKPHECPYP